MPWRGFFFTAGLLLASLLMIVELIRLIDPPETPLLIDAKQSVNCEVVFVDEPELPRNNYDYRINKPYRDGRTT